MIKKLFKIIILVIIFFLLIIFCLSYFGVETSRFNSVIELGFEINCFKNSGVTSEVEMTLDLLFLSITRKELNIVLPP